MDRANVNVSGQTLSPCVRLFIGWLIDELDGAPAQSSRRIADRSLITVTTTKGARSAEEVAPCGRS